MANDGNESWGKRMQDAIAHFESTGEIQEILGLRFDQRGCWIPFISNEKVEKALIEKLVGTKLDPERLTNTNDSGEITLLCSFVDHSEGTVVITYHHVKGQILVSEAGTLDAPKLLSVGERMVSICAMEFHIPKLQSVGGALEAQSAVKFNAPNLQSVGVWLCAQGAIEFHAPKLESVGGGLNALFAEKFHIPKLQSVEQGLDAGSALKFDAPELQSVGGGPKRRVSQTIQRSQTEIRWGGSNRLRCQRFLRAQLGIRGGIHGRRIGHEIECWQAQAGGRRLEHQNGEKLLQTLPREGRSRRRVDASPRGKEREGNSPGCAR